MAEQVPPRRQGGFKVGDLPTPHHLRERGPTPPTAKEESKVTRDFRKVSLPVPYHQRERKPAPQK